MKRLAEVESQIPCLPKLLAVFQTLGQIFSKALPAPPQAPAPAPSPVPVATASSLALITPNPTVAAYANQIYPLLVAYASAVKDFGALNEQASKNIAIINDSDWRIAVTFDLELMQMYSEKLSDIEGVSQDLRELQVIFLSIRQETQQLATDYIAGMDQLDSNKLDQAFAHAKSIAVYLDNLNVVLEKLGPKPTGTAVSTNRVCCRVCTTGKACGDTCISKDKTCDKPPGCACDQ